MTSFWDDPKWKVWAIGAAAVVIVFGVLLRFYNLSASGFFFYDEGLYLQHNLFILDLIKANPPQTFTDSWQAFLAYLKMALGSGKSFWFFLMDSRFFLGGNHDWAYAKYLACFLGVAAIPLVYLFARRFYGSKKVAVLSAVMFAILPAAVFYSRLALQEAFSTVLVLLGFYLYLFAEAAGRRVILAGMVLAAAFFSNYRLLMLPFLVGATELWLAFARRQAFAWRKYIWFCLAFAACVVLIGSALDAANMQVVFAWVFHQEDTARGQFAWINFLSYPYYLFAMETFLFALAFFASAWLLVKGEREKMLPFVLVFVQMAVFSLPSEKGARYVAVVLPFAVMSAAFLIISIFKQASVWQKNILTAFVVLMVLCMAGKSVQLAQTSSGHESLVNFMKGKNSAFFSSQEMVDGLYVPNKKMVMPVPPGFDRLADGYKKGYRYLVIDPQAYVSLSGDTKFNTQLKDHLGFIETHVTPVKVFPHMTDAFLERFVLEHSENLGRSVAFLNDRENRKKFMSIRVYDLAQIVPMMESVLSQARQRGKNGR